MTDNFLHNLRNQGNKRFDRNRNKPFDNQYRPNDRFAGRDRKGAPQRKTSDADQLQPIKRLLEGLLEQQRRLVEFGERSTKAAERQAEALESIARQFNPTDAVVEDTPQDVSAEAAETAGTVEIETEPDEPDLEASNDSDAVADAPEKPNPRQTAGELIIAQRDQDQSFEQIAQYLNDQDIPTLSGKGRWRPQSVSRLYNSLVASSDDLPTD